MMCNNFTWRLLATLMGCAVLSGCGSSVGTVPVSGQVTLDGAPLADAHVSFEPVRNSVTDDAIGSFATTDGEGRFVLRLVTTNEQGAMPGSHTVRITTARAEDPSREDSPITPELAPEEYRRGVEFEVPAEGTSSANFALSSNN